MVVATGAVVLHCYPDSLSLVKKRGRRGSWVVLTVALVVRERGHDTFLVSMRLLRLDDRTQLGFADVLGLRVKYVDGEQIDSNANSRGVPAN